MNSFPNFQIILVNVNEIGRSYTELTLTFVHFVKVTKKSKPIVHLFVGSIFSVNITRSWSITTMKHYVLNFSLGVSFTCFVLVVVCLGKKYL